MELIIKCSAFIIVILIITLTLKKEAPVIMIMLTLGIAIFILLTIIPQITSIKEELDSLLQNSGISNDIILPLLKIVGISIVTRITSDICKDGGEWALASQIELVGTVAALIVTLPLFSIMLDLITSIK